MYEEKNNKQQPIKVTLNKDDTIEILLYYL